MKLGIGSIVRCVIGSDPYLKVGQTYTIKKLFGSNFCLVGVPGFYSRERFINPIIETKLGRILYK